MWALALVALAAAAGCVPMGGLPGRGSERAQFASNGERIYFTATSASGRPISYQGGPTGGMMMQRLACASCHGPQGHGGRVTMMMQTFEAPNVTWPALTEEHHEAGEMEHPPYTEQTVKRAITQGLDPAGHPLDAVMPRWSMSEEDLDDLVSYLKTLK